MTVLNSAVPNKEIGMAREIIASRQLADRNHTIFVDHGFLCRKDYWSVGMNGVNRKADFFTLDAPDRWEKLGIELLPWKPAAEGKHVLIIGQCPDDPQVMFSDHWGWVKRTIRSAKNLNLPILFRPHPRARVKYDSGLFVGAEVVDPNTDLLDLVDNARIVWTFNSTVGITSVIRGVRTITEDCHSMVWGRGLAYASWGYYLGQSSWEPHEEARVAWARQLAYSQWTTEEIASGMVWDHMYRRYFHASTNRVRPS